MADEKKVVLFIVEGPSEETALEPLFKQLFDRKLVQFHVTHCDITSDRQSQARTIKSAAGDCIKAVRERYRYKPGDFLRVIQIIDTDGAFIPDECVRNIMADGGGKTLIYTETGIEAINPDKIIQRNQRKRANVSVLYTASKISNIPYSMYYFSRNMEHVLHGDAGDPSDDEKRDYAEAFAERYEGDIEGFKLLMRSNELAVHGDYGETWQYVFTGTNSLKRGSNLRVLLDSLDEVEKS